MSAAPDKHTMSTSAYLALEAANPDIRYEYLDGRITMMSGGSLNHSRISLNIGAYLLGALRGSSCQAFNSDARVKLNNDRYVYPDITVSCSTAADDVTQNITEPVLVVEVLSPGTAAYDRGEKLRGYRECPSIMIILLVAQDEPHVEAYFRHSQELWDVHIYGSEDVIALTALGVTLPVAEIYRQVSFVTP